MSPRMGGYVPADHASRHQDGGRDEINIANLSGSPAELITHAADIDAHMVSMWQTLRTGEYHALVNAYYVSSVAVVADTLYAYPYVVVRTMTIDRIAIYVATGVSGKARLGIYNTGTNLYPGTLLLDAGEVDVTSSTLVAATVSQQLTKGVYFFVLVSNVAPDLHGGNTNRGGITILGQNIANFGQTYAGWSVSFSYAALPDPFPAGGSLINTGALHHILPRVASLD